MVERKDRPPGLDRRQEDQCSHFNVAGEASRLARCTADHRLRDERRAEADQQTHFWTPSDGPAISGTPRVPADRAKALRRAFMDTMNDRDFLADAESSQFEITPVSGERVQMLVTEIYGTPTEIGHKAAAILQ
jgi:hypothetical protein